MLHKKKRITSILLALAIMLTLIPFAAVPVAAAAPYSETIEVSTWYELRSLLGDTTKNNILIKLIADIDQHYTYSIKSRPPENLVVNGIKAVDLSGFNLSYTNDTRWYVVGASFGTSLFDIQGSATLLMMNSDPAGDAWVRTDGYMTENEHNRFGHADIFFVRRDGTLIIDSGNYMAGRSKKTWGTSLNATGYGYRMIKGYVVDNDGTVIVNGGNLYSNGSDVSFAVINNNSIFEDESYVGNGKAIINGGYLCGIGGSDCFGFSERAPNPNITVNGGSFDTSSLRVIYSEFGGEYAEDIEGVINLPKECINPQFSGYHYDGRDYLPGDMKENDFKNSQQLLTIKPGNPVLKLTPQVEDDFYIISKDSTFKIGASVEPYFTELGLGRQSGLHYYVVENSQTKDWDAEFNPETSTVGLRDYYYQVTETLPGQGNADPNAKWDIKPFSVYVVAEDKKPVVTITASKNPVNIGDNVTLTATTDQDGSIVGYTWYQIDETTGISTNLDTNSATFTPPTTTAGEYIYRCDAQGLNATGTSPSFIFKVAVETAPSITETAIYLKKDVLIDGTVMPLNIGGAVDEWSYTGTLPAGVVLATKDYGFDGKPTEDGTFPIELTATNDYGSDTKTVTIYVSSSLGITTSLPCPDAVIGTDYKKEQYYTGSGDVTWSISKGVLPPGLTLNTKTGRISGTPKIDNAQVDGVYTFTVRLTAPGETHAEKEMSITLRKAPEYPDEVTETVPLGAPMYIESPLTKGTASTPASMPITFTLSDAPDGLYVVNQGKNINEVGHLKWDNPVAGTYEEFTLTATNAYGIASTKVKLTVADAPKIMPSGEVPIGEEGTEYSYQLIGAYPANSSCVWAIDTTDFPEPAGLPAGLTLDPASGLISGTPTTATDTDLSGALTGTSFYVTLTDPATGLSDKIYIMKLAVLPAGSFKAPTEIKFDKYTFSSNIQDGAVITTGGVPAPKITLVGGALPQSYTFFDFDISNSLWLKTIYNGTFNFRLRAENSEGFKEEDFTINVVSPEKAAPPTANPAAGLYKKGETENVKLVKPSGVMGIYYSINGGDMQPWSTFEDTYGIDITKDTVIKAYSTNYGFSTLDSDVVEFKYTFVDDPNLIPPTTTITTNTLPSGTIDTSYPETQLTATTTSSQPITWVANGLPVNMALSSDGKLTGKPEEVGTFNVEVLATAETSDSKTLTLNIAQTPAATPTIETQPSSATYKLNATAIPLTVAATSTDGGTISYQWYQSNDESNATKTDDMLVSAGDSFTPPTSSTQTRYYYVLAINRKAGYDDTSVTSNVAKIIILYDAATPTFDDMENMEYTFTEGTQLVLRQSAEVQDSGTLTYLWYKMTGDKKDPASNTRIYSGTDGNLDITVAAAGSTEKYYAVATNTNNNATGDKVKTAIGPTHVVNSIEEVIVNSITVTTLPGKTSYYVGEAFNPAGLVVTATLSDGTTKEIALTDLSFAPAGALALSDNSIEISYQDPINQNTFTANVPVTVSERPSSGGGGGVVSSYTLTFEVNGGSKLDSISKVSGTEITLAEYNPTREGYDFAGWYTDKGLTNKVTSVKLTANTTVYAKWAETSGLPFIDVKADDWFYDDVAYVYEKEIMKGIESTLFAPHIATNRGMIVTILYRLEKEPAVSGSNPFDDVESGSYYENAITWAATNNIVTGYGDNKFGPDDPITREQMATILYRYAKYKGYDVSKAADLTGFSDAGSISDYALISMKWANAEGLITGTTETTLAPVGNAERCQVAAIIHRFLETVAK